MAHDVREAVGVVAGRVGSPPRAAAGRRPVGAGCRSSRCRTRARRRTSMRAPELAYTVTHRPGPGCPQLSKAGRVKSALGPSASGRRRARRRRRQSSHTPAARCPASSSARRRDVGLGVQLVARGDSRFTAAGASRPAAASPDGKIFVWLPGTSGRGPAGAVAAAQPGSAVPAPSAWGLAGSWPSVRRRRWRGRARCHWGLCDTERPGGLPPHVEAVGLAVCDPLSGALAVADVALVQHLSMPSARDAQSGHVGEVGEGVGVGEREPAAVRRVVIEDGELSERVGVSGEIHAACPPTRPSSDPPGRRTRWRRPGTTGRVGGGAAGRTCRPRAARHPPACSQPPASGMGGCRRRRAAPRAAAQHEAAQAGQPRQLARRRRGAPPGTMSRGRRAGGLGGMS